MNVNRTSKTVSEKSQNSRRLVSWLTNNHRKTKIYFSASKRKSNMKVIVVVFFICALIGLSQEFNINIKFRRGHKELEVVKIEMKEYKLCLNKKYKNVCIKKSDLTPNRTELLERNELTMENMTNTDICYFTCMLKENHIMKKNGKLNITRITRAMPENTASEVSKYINHLTKIYNLGKKDNCIHQGNVFLDMISMLKTYKNITLTTIYKGTDVFNDTNVYDKYQSCGTSEW